MGWGVAYAGVCNGAGCLCGRPIRQFVDAAFYNAKAYNYLTLAHFTLTYRFPKCQLEQPVHFSPPSSGEPSLHPAHSYDDGSALALNVQPPAGE